MAKKQEKRISGARMNIPGNTFHGQQARLNFDQKRIASALLDFGISLSTLPHELKKLRCSPLISEDFLPNEGGKRPFLTN